MDPGGAAFSFDAKPPLLLAQYDNVRPIAKATNLLAIRPGPITHGERRLHADRSELLADVRVPDGANVRKTRADVGDQIVQRLILRIRVQEICGRCSSLRDQIAQPLVPGDAGELDADRSIVYRPAWWQDFDSSLSR